MSYTKTQGKTLNLNPKHYSDGSELIPAEVQASTHQDEAQSVDTPFAAICVNKICFNKNLS